MKVEIRNTNNIVFKRLEDCAIFRYDNVTYFKDDIYMKIPTVKDEDKETYNAINLSNECLAWFNENELVTYYENVKLVIE